MHVFDPSQTHGQVCGGSVRLYEQNGVIFDVNHQPVQLLADGSVLPLKVDAPVAEPSTSDSYTGKTTDELKQLCTVYGIEFKSRQQAIRDLEGA
jgi:hypothetical protein